MAASEVKDKRDTVRSVVEMINELSGQTLTADLVEMLVQKLDPDSDIDAITQAFEQFRIELTTANQTDSTSANSTNQPSEPANKSSDK